MADSQASTSSPEHLRATLVARECVVLAATANGLGIGQVAELLEIPSDIVRAALCTAVEKLHARSRRDAVRIALMTGQLDLPRDEPPRDRRRQ